jgi:hypothetical protein
VMHLIDIIVDELGPELRYLYRNSKHNQVPIS